MGQGGDFLPKTERLERSTSSDYPNIDLSAATLNSRSPHLPTMVDVPPSFTKKTLTPP